MPGEGVSSSWFKSCTICEHNRAIKEALRHGESVFNQFFSVFIIIYVICFFFTEAGLNSVKHAVGPLHSANYN